MLDEAQILVSSALTACEVMQILAAVLGRILDGEEGSDLTANYVQSQPIHAVIEVGLKAKTAVREVYMNLQEGLMMWLLG